MLQIVWGNRHCLHFDRFYTLYRNTAIHFSSFVLKCIYTLDAVIKQDANGPQFAHLYICKCKSSSIATATGTQISPYHKTVKGHPSLIILTNSVHLESPMVYTKIQPQSFLSTGEEFLSVFTINGQGSHLVQ